MNGNVQNFLWRKRAAQLLPGSTKQRLCSPKNHWHVSLQSVGVIVNAVGLPRIAQRLVLQGHLKCWCWWSTLGWGCWTAPAVWDVCVLLWHIPANKQLLGILSDCRLLPAERDMQQAVLSLWMSQNSAWSHLSGMQGNGRSLLAYHLLWGTSKRRTTAWTLTTLNTGSLTTTVPQMEMNVQQNVFTSAADTEQ